MALGKPRSARRSSSSSSTYCTSTITMLVFIVFAVIALWMLTSSSVVPPQSTTTRTSNAFSTTSSSSSSSSQDSKSVKNKDPPVFEDTQGDLPDDAIKGDTKSDAAKAGQEGKQALLERARDPEVTATAEQQEDGGGGNVNGNGNSKEEEKGKSELNMQVNMQEKESESNLEKNGEIENTQKGKEEESSSENQNQSQSQMENPQQSNKETEESNTKQEIQQQEAEMESKETQQQQQQIQQESQEEVHESIQQRHEETLQNQQSTEAESTGNTQQEETGSENQEKSQQGQLETENQENTQQNQQETESESQEQNQQSSQSDSENGQKPQEMSDTTTDHQQQQLQEDSAQDNQQSQSQQLQEDSGQDTQHSQSQQEDSQQAQSQQENTHTENQQEVAQKEGKASGIPKESNESKESWSTQENQSENQKERRKEDELSWELCHVTAGADYIPCLDNEKALRQIHSTRHYEHRERHCPEEGPTCLVPLPVGYKRSIEWPKSRDKIWYHNVPHTKLAEVKGHQNWVKVTGEFLTFPGGGTQFIHGALHYIDFIEKSVPNIAWGKRTRVVLDVGCGVASFGGYLFDRDVLTMSFAPKDEHEAQVQFALERGIPAISAVMGSQRLQFPSRVFDIVHCARCRVPWHVEGGMLLLELNRVLRPGGYFVWSATPVYQKLDEDVQIWKEMSKLTQSMCWELVTIKKDKLNGVGAAIYRKPDTNDCYEHRKHNKPPMCKDDDDANAAWYVPLQACMHRAPVDESERGSRWPEKWPARVHKPPYWLNNSQKGIYGKYAPDDFSSDHEHWKRVVTKTYMSGLGISWSNVRNVMDMRAVYGGFAAALKDLKVWVMNVVNVDCPDTLPIIYERGLFGIYHDWCESFSTYPRTYDLLHADHLFSSLKKRCNLLPVIAEVDRIVRPGGKFIVRDEVSMIGEIENMLKSLHWEIHLSFSKGQDGILSAQKSDWRPQTSASSS